MRRVIFASLLPLAAIFAYFTWADRWMAGFVAGTAACLLSLELIGWWEESQRRKLRKAWEDAKRKDAR